MREKNFLLKRKTCKKVSHLFLIFFITLNIRAIYTKRYANIINNVLTCIKFIDQSQHFSIQSNKKIGVRFSICNLSSISAFDENFTRKCELIFVLCMIG